MDRIAFYGLLLSGLRAGALPDLPGGLRFERPCRIPGVLYDLGGYPALRPGEGSVRGELYAIDDPPVLARLDAFEGFKPDDEEGSLYVRRSVALLEPPEEAWVYVYNRDPSGRPAIASGDWRAHRSGR
ncbi:MAG: gamma-glutamylcyclotransferase [Actinomycetota bacterium]|nr:gamma-glutamylcyclotransferase [Actinomycetota bacterium]